MDSHEPVDLGHVERAIDEAREARDHLLEVDPDAIEHDEGRSDGAGAASGDGHSEPAADEAAPDSTGQAPTEPEQSERAPTEPEQSEQAPTEPDPTEQVPAEDASRGLDGE